MMKLYRYNDVPLETLLIRSVEKTGVSDAVRAIIEDVEARGDAALFEYAKRFDGAELSALIGFEGLQREIHLVHGR